MNTNPSVLDWQRRYEDNDTPWDKGCPAPPLQNFLTHESLSGRVLVPGCGRGYEVRLLAEHRDTSVVGLDLASTAIAEAQALTPSSLVGASYLVADFFELPPSLVGSFDWLVEHTCFCAIEPARRPDYVLAAAKALKKDGKIFAIFYLDPGTENGPPFSVTREELDELFSPTFVLIKEWVPQQAFAGREQRELVRILQLK